MLEILILSVLTNRIGKTVEAKGYKSGKYKWTTVGLWFGGEIVGLFLGALMAGGDESATCLIYIIALLGAAVGAAIANSTANNLPIIGPSLLPTTPGGIPASQEDHVQKLKKLKEMYDAGLITAQDYDTQKAEILSRLVNESVPTPATSLADVSDSGNALEKFIQKINSLKLEEPAEDYLKHGMALSEKFEFDDAILEFVKVIRISKPEDNTYQTAKKQLKGMGFSESDIRQISR